MKPVTLALLGSLAIAAVPPANAADMNMPYKAPPLAPALGYNWTGIYLGINGGYGWGDQDPFNIITNRFDNSSIEVFRAGPSVER